MAPPASGQLEAKNYIVLAALTAILVAAAVVTIVSVVMRPARIIFFVTEAGSRLSGDGSVQLNLAIATNNTSRRAAVSYKSMFVDVYNSTGPEWVVGWIGRANMSTAMPLRQSPRSVTKVVATLSLFLGENSAEAFIGHMTEDRAFTVLVTAQARFKVGIAWTRLYNIRVSCLPVYFFADNQSGATECLAAY